MDWWKGSSNHAGSNSEAPSKTTRKYTKTKNKAEIGSTIGQSTMLAFVENKEPRSLLVDPSGVSTSSSVGAPSLASTDTNPGCIQPRLSCDMQKLGNNFRQMERDDFLNTPSVERVSVNDGLSTGSDAENSCIVNDLSLPLTEAAEKSEGTQESPDSARQVEPTRRSARLKSIQVKQALKDDFISDDDDFQPRTVRTREEAPLSKGRLFFLNKEEKEKLRLMEEKKQREEEEEKQREREKQQCERLREEIKRAKEENLQRSLGRQFNPFLLPRAVVTSQAIFIDGDEDESKVNAVLWKDDQDGSLSPFPLISHITQHLKPNSSSVSDAHRTEEKIHEIYCSISMLSSISSCLKNHFDNQIQQNPLRPTFTSVPTYLTSYNVTAIPSAAVCAGLGCGSLRKTMTSTSDQNLISEKSGRSQLMVPHSLLPAEQCAVQDPNPTAQLPVADPSGGSREVEHNVVQALAEFTEKDHHEVEVLLKRFRGRRGMEDGRKQWIDTYRPRNGHEVCGNQDNVKMLRKWLTESDKDSSHKRQKHTTSSRKRQDSEEDDESEDQSCQAILISGPSGCGKSAAVYAVAEELKLQVLEINSSDKRCGRLVLDKVGEATRSQSLLKRDQPVPLHERPATEKRKPGRLKSGQDEQGRDELSEVGGTMALILFEEIDVLLDHDKGFLAAVIALVQQTCVPIVMTCQRESTLPIHPGAKYSLQELTTMLIKDSAADKPSTMESLGLRELEWRSPDLRDAMLHLQIISAVEGVSHSFEAMRRTFTFCKCDFRRTLMQLQLASLNQANHIEMVSPSLRPDGYQSSSLPRAISVANGLLRLETFEPDLQFVGEDGVSQQISFKAGMVRTSRMFEDADGILDALFNTTWRSFDFLMTDITTRNKAELDRLLEISLLTDAMSHALLLSEAHEDIRKCCIGSCLSSTAACIAAGCLHLGDQSNQVDWFAPKNRFERLPTISCQKEHCSDLAYPRACGVGRVSSVMLEYAPWVRDMCKTEEEKKVNGAFRRRRAAHHLSGLSPLALDSFSSTLILNTTIIPSP